MILKDNLIIRTVKEKDLNLLHKWNSQKSRGEYQEFNFESSVKLRKHYEDNGFNSENKGAAIWELRSEWVKEFVESN